MVSQKIIGRKKTLFAFVLLRHEGRTQAKVPHIAHILKKKWHCGKYAWSSPKTIKQRNIPQWLLGSSRKVFFPGLFWKFAPYTSWGLLNHPQVDRV